MLALLVLLHAAGAAPASAQRGASDPGGVTGRNGAAAAIADAALRLRPGDAVRLAVQDEPLLAGEYPILEDGTVLLPLIGLVQVAGIAFGDVREAVRVRYDAELVDRRVVIQPLVRVRVLGEVRQPGLYLVDGTYSVADVVAQAGGLMPSASVGRIVVVRDGRRLPVNLRDDALLDVVLPGDELQVPRRGWLSENTPILVGAGTSVLAAAITALLVR